MRIKDGADCGNTRSDHRVETLHMKMYLDVHTRMGTPHMKTYISIKVWRLDIKMCSDVNNR